MRLFLDDTRPFPAEGYECCRDARTAILFLSVMKFDFVSLDFHLGGEETGLDVLVWMKEHGVQVPNINIHSNHIIGRERMREYCLENFPDSKVTMNLLPK